MKKNKEENVNLEEKVEELEKSNKWMKGILLLLVLVFFMVICIYAGVVIGKSMNDNNKEKNDKNDIKVEEENNEEEKEDIELEQLTKDSDVVKKLFEVFREDKNCRTTELWMSATEQAAKLYIAYTSLDDSSFIRVKCGDLDDSYNNGLYCAMNDEAGKYYAEQNEVGFENAIKNETTRGIKESVLEAKYKELFGINAKMNKGDFSIGYGPIAHYDKENKVYAEFNCECGGECVPSNHTLDSITQKGEKLILYTTLISEDDILNETVSYTFEYEKETGNYIFVSREAK